MVHRLKSHFKPNFYLMFNNLNGLVKSQGDDTQYNNAGDYHIQLEHLGTVYDQIPKSPSCSQKFPDDDTHQCQPDVHFGGTEQDRNGTGEHYFEKGIFPAASQGVDQGNFLRVNLLESRVKAYNGTEYGDGHAGDDNGSGSGAQPHNKKWCQGGFGQTV